MNREMVAILGAAESGMGAALLAKQKGYEVFVSDYHEIDEKNREVLLNNEIQWEENGHSIEKLSQATVVVKSPGIPETAAIIQALKKRGKKIVSEIEFASQFTNAMLIGITGSNGKTTTASLIYRLVSDAGKNVKLGGNIGKSFAGLLTEGDAECFILELSSFQLDGIENFKPHIAVMTNLSPDHLDRYEHDYEKYIAAKFRMIMNQNHEDYFIYNADDINIVRWIENIEIKSKLIPFSTKKQMEKGVFLNENKIIITIDNEPIIMPTKTIGIKGEHNLKNAMAASTVAKLLQIRKQTIRESLERFQGVEHRLETVAKINNVLYINDSKATNVNATYYALESVKSPVIWIVGGVDKGNDYSDLLLLVHEKVKAIICLGIDNEKIKKTFSGIVDTFIETSSMKEAVMWSQRLSEKNNTVLLSPACASFDLFKNYEDRGRQFKEAVRNLS